MGGRRTTGTCNRAKGESANDGNWGLLANLQQNFNGPAVKRGKQMMRVDAHARGTWTRRQSLRQPRTNCSMTAPAACNTRYKERGCSAARDTNARIMIT